MTRTEGELVIGVDGGGSGCRARLFGPDGAALGEGTGGPANLLLGRPATDAILTACRAALAEAGLPSSDIVRCRLGLAVAGATPRGRQALRGAGGPFDGTVVMSDAVGAVIGAHGGADGGVAILGTGAVACAWIDGAARVVGGHGGAVDDLGSGVDIGRALGRLALRAADDHAAGGGTPSGVAARLLRHHGGAGGLTDWFAAARPAEVAALAPMAFEAQEAATEAILASATAELERLMSLLVRMGAPRLCVRGSVGLRLVERVAPCWRTRLVPARGDAADGAALAVRLGLIAS